MCIQYKGNKIGQFLVSIATILQHKLKIFAGLNFSALIVNRKMHESFVPLNFKWIQ